MIAKTIEPAIGASTYAFESHRWRPCNGNLTMKTAMHPSHVKLFDQAKYIVDKQKKFSEPKRFCK